MHQDGLLNRRDLLRVGSLSVAASTIPGGLAEAAATGVRGQAKSVIYLWMGGGVTHHESFDPKPDAPQEIRGTLDAIPTKMPGIQFSEVMPNMSKVADQVALLRNFSHDSDDHLLSQVYTLSGRKVDRNGLFTEPNIGSLVSYLQGPRNGLPGYIAVPGITRPGPPPHNLFVAGWLGSQYKPYCLGGLPAPADFTVEPERWDNPDSFCEEDLRPKSLVLSKDIPLSRLDRRAQLRDSFDTALRSLEKLNDLSAAEGQYRNALRLLATPQVRDAFDLTKESTAIRDDYGRTKIGGRCLMARRLVESGARFVMVDYGYDLDYGNLWDNHAVAVQRQPHICEIAKRGYHVAGIDKAFAALINDLRERGMLDSTLVVFLTEFGRTPRINKNGGRDHWGKAGSLFFTGGGTKTGQVIGATDKHGAEPITHGYTPADVAATIYAALGINHRAMVRDLLDRPLPVLDHGEPIREIL
jgi:hypothetical protein